MRFANPEFTDKSDAEAAIMHNDPEELLYIPIAVSLSTPDFAWSQDICIRLAKHSDFKVRGNAILGFGHLARRFGQLNEVIVKPLIQAALNDTNDFVRGQADAASDDIAHYLKWKGIRLQ